MVSLRALALLWGVAAAHNAFADVRYNPRVELGVGYDDNAGLAGTGDAKIKTSGQNLDARVEILALGPAGQWRLTPAVNGTYHPSNSNLNSNGEFLYLFGEHHGPRYATGLFSYLSSQTLLKGYLPTAALAGGGLGQPEPGQTLGNLTNIRQNLGYVDPTYSLQLTQRRRLELNASFLKTEYNHSLAGYTGYRDIAGSVGVVLDATQTGSLALRLTGLNFKPEVGSSAHIYGFTAEWDGHFAANKQYYAKIGVDRASFSATGTAAVVSPSSTDVSGGLGAHWTYQVTDLFVDLTREVAPTAQGYAVKQSQLRLRFERRVTERFAAFVGVRGINDDPFSQSGATIPSQRYLYGTTGFEWRAMREFTLVGSYVLTHRKYIGPSAESNTIQLSVVYEPNRLAEGPAITVGY
jgi:hypothetical protein